MRDRAASVLGLVVVALLAWFIESWFGWQKILWILGSTAGAFVAAALLVRITRKSSDAERIDASASKTPND